ncbi:DUF3073 domain-containing protein [Streptacidiphilus sp. MAP5-3]|jgi:hypothetical protein|uniref:DUF3073 domain-containing protein n=1 Tax=unclassified Streptacidiphilus TaxID=2643834 RepID=UPI00351255C0
MGRGRAKAKQTKVARQLKYNSGGFDASRLANELGVASTNETVNPEPFDDDEEEDDDPYASYYSDEDDEDVDESPPRKRA